MGSWINLLVGPLAGEAKGFVARKRRDLIILSVVGLLLLSAYALGLTAGTIYLAETFGAAAAAGLVAAGMLLLAMILLTILTIVHAREKRRRNAGQAIATSAAIGLLPYLLRSNTRLAVLGAGGLGVLAAILASRHGDEND